MDDSRIRITVDAHGVADVALARAGKMNALDPAMFEAIAGAIGALEKDPQVRCVVLHGEGKAFCAGLDKGTFEAIAGGKGLAGDLSLRTHGQANLFQHVCWGWRTLPVPVIAAVHGVAFGGGLQVALGADVRIVHPQARLSVLEIKWGLVPDMAGCVFMAELLRTDVARELTFTGRMVAGDEAVRIGLCTRLADDPLAAAREMAREIAGRSPGAIRAAKRLLNGAGPVRSAEVLLRESQEQAALIGGPDQLEAIRAGLENRAPVFR